MLPEKQSCFAEDHKDQYTRHDWQISEAAGLFSLPFNDLIYRAQTVHRQNFPQNKIQLSTLLNIKSGGCPEDCAYCPQSVRHKTTVENEKMLSVEDVLTAARGAKESGASRFCMGAAWRSPKDGDLRQVLEMIKGVKSLGLETCATLGMLTKNQANDLKESGLDFYNHNLDTSESYYPSIISTRTYQDRLNTLEHVRGAGMNVCCGGIVGMGESLEDRAEMLCVLANMPKHPESVPINLLVKVQGTPLAKTTELNHLDFVKIVAVARIMLPASYVRLSAGRDGMSDTTQALCYLAGANSVFYGERLLTTENPQQEKDKNLFSQLGLSSSG